MNGTPASVPLQDTLVQLKAHLAHALPTLFSRMGGVTLGTGGSLASPQMEWDTVYTLAEGHFPLVLTMHLSASLAWRASCHMLRSEYVGREDIEECEAELLNVLAGQTLSTLYQHLDGPVRLHAPTVVAGKENPAPVAGGGDVLFFHGCGEDRLEVHFLIPDDGLPPALLPSFGGTG